MKTIPVLLQADFDERIVRRVLCVRVVRSDSQVFRFTSSQVPLTVGAEDYLPGLGLTTSQTSVGAGLAVNDMQVKGPLQDGISSSLVTEDDLLSGRWDGAQYVAFAVNPLNPAHGIDPAISGTFGRVTSDRVSFEVELRDLMQHYQAPIGEVSTAGCRVKKLGDARCRANLTSHAFASVAVTSFTSRAAFQASALTQAVDWFAFGEMQWQTGSNAGLKAEVKAFGTGGIVGLQWPMPHDIAVGDTFTIITGCDRTAASCQGKFANIINYVGEPNKPTGDQLTRGPK